MTCCLLLSHIVHMSRHIHIFVVRACDLTNMRGSATPLSCKFLAPSCSWAPPRAAHSNVG
jgi:hypothetical protein